MKIPLTLFLTAISFCISSIAFAASTKNYQVTGPIVSLTDTMIVVQKGDEQWEIARDAKTRADSQLKVGKKVTVQYRMIATNIDVKTTGTLSEPSKKAGGENATKTTPSSITEAATHP